MRTTVLLCLLLCLGIPAQPAREYEPTFALVNCRVVTVSGPLWEKGTIVIREGRLDEVGPADKIAVPEDAEVIDASGLTAYPGLIDVHSRVFLEPVREEPAGREGMSPAASPQGFHPEAQAYRLIKPKKSDRDALHRAGFTTVLIAPPRGIFAGQSVLLNLNGEETDAMVLRNPVALHLQFVTERGVYPSSLMGTMAVLRQAFLDADHYARQREAWSSAPRRFRRPEYNPFLEALEPYVIGKKPIVFTCENQEDIRRALRLAEEFKLNAALSGANEAWRVADSLKKTKTPLFVSLSFKPPAVSRYAVQGEELKKKAEIEIYPANAATLYKAGVAFALTSYGISQASDFVKNIQAAVEAGLPREEAIKSLTLRPARFLGMEAALGSLEKGKIANVILTAGELFEGKTEVRMVFVDGRRFRVEKAQAPAPGAASGAFSLKGSWEGKLQSPMGDLDITLELTQQGASVSGSMKSDMGAWPIRDGMLNGSILTFTLQAVMMGRPMELPFEGRVDKDSIEGALSSSRGKMDVRLKKIPGE